MDKGEGRGRGKWTAKGVQATQQGDIDALKALVAEMAERLDALEGEGEPTEEPTDTTSDSGGQV